MFKNILFLLLFCFFTQAQSEIQVEYELLYHIEGFEEIPSIEGKIMQEKIFKSQKFVTFTLISDGKKACFFNNPFVFSDDDENDFMLKAIVLNNHAYYYTNLNTLDLISVKNFAGKEYITTYDQRNWEVTNESKIIQGYTCYKAIFTKIINNLPYEQYAWFTPEIPFNFGPLEWCNLPGLVLEYQNSKSSIVAKKIKFNVEDVLKQKLIKPEGKIYTKDEFDKIVQKVKDSY